MIRSVSRAAVFAVSIITAFVTCDAHHAANPVAPTQQTEQPAPAPAPPAPDPGPPPAPALTCDPHANCTSVVQQIYSQVNPPHNPQGAFEVTKRVAWQLRASGLGLLLKPTGDNIVQWKGQWFSAGRVCFPDGHIYKIFGGVGAGNNTPEWEDNGFVDPKLYVAAMDPDK